VLNTRRGVLVAKAESMNKIDDSLCADET